MISELFAGEVSWWLLLLQSTVCMVLGLIASFCFKRQAARAHQILMLGIIVALFVPFLSVLANRYGLGLLKAEPQASRPVLRDATGALPLAGKAGGEEARPGSMITGAPLSLNDASVPLSAVPGPSAHAPVPVEAEAPTVTGNSIRTLSRPHMLMGVWGLLSLVLLLRLMRNFILGTRLLRTAEPLDNVKLTETMFNACSKLGVRHNIDIRISQTVHSPIIWCWGVRPILLVPTGTHNLTKHADWLGLFCHEVAHWKRRDHLVGLGTELLVSLLWWHPLLWWAKQRLLCLSEQACDDWVLASGQAGPDYAELLLNLLPEGRMAFVPTIVGKENTMKERIHRIIKHPGSNPRVGWNWALITLLITLSVAVGTALAQRRPARVAEHEHQERLGQHEELMETIHYLETRIKVNQKEIQGLEQNDRGQGVKARILRDEVRRMREQLRELKPVTRERDIRHPAGAQSHGHLRDTPRDPEELAQRAEYLEQELREMGDGNPNMRKELRFELQTIHQHLARMHQDVEHRSEHAAQQRAHQEHAHNLSRARDELAEAAQRLEQDLREMEESNPAVTEKLRRDLAETHKHLQQMHQELGQYGPGLEAHEGAHEEHAHEPGIPNDPVLHMQKLEQTADLMERELREIEEQDRGDSDEARTLQKRLQTLRMQMARNEDTDRMRQLCMILRHEIHARENELKARPDNQDQAALQLRERLALLRARHAECERSLAHAEEDRPRDMDTDIEMDILMDVEMSVPEEPAFPGERQDGRLQDQVTDLHGKMDQLTGEMQELRHLLQQVLQQQQQRKMPLLPMPPLRDIEEIEEIESSF